MRSLDMIRFEKAKTEYANALALVSWRTFDNGVSYGAPGPGGPPGYKSDRWQSKMMRIGKYYKILANDRIIGGFIEVESPLHPSRLYGVWHNAEEGEK